MIGQKRRRAQQGHAFGRGNGLLRGDTNIRMKLHDRLNRPFTVTSALARAGLSLSAASGSSPVHFAPLFAAVIRLGPDHCLTAIGTVSAGDHLEPGSHQSLQILHSRRVVKLNYLVYRPGRGQAPPGGRRGQRRVYVPRFEVYLLRRCRVVYRNDSQRGQKGTSQPNPVHMWNYRRNKAVPLRELPKYSYCG